MPCPPDHLNYPSYEDYVEAMINREFNRLMDLYYECLNFAVNVDELEQERKKSITKKNKDQSLVRDILRKLEFNEYAPYEIMAKLDKELGTFKNNKTKPAQNESSYVESGEESVIKDTVEEELIPKIVKESDLPKALKDCLELSEILRIVVLNSVREKLDQKGWETQLNYAREHLKSPDQKSEETEVRLCRIRNFLAQLFFKHNSGDLDSFFDDRFIHHLEQHKLHRAEDRTFRIKQLEDQISKGTLGSDKKLKFLQQIDDVDWLCGMDAY